MANRTQWSVYIYTSGGSWLADSNIYAPNANFNMDITSTKQTRKLANGDNATFTPEIKSNPEALVFTWAQDDGTLRNIIQTYVNSQDYLKIIDSNGDYYTGYFIDVKPVWLLDIYPDAYDIQANFLRI